MQVSLNLCERIWLGAYDARNLEPRFVASGRRFGCYPQGLQGVYSCVMMPAVISASVRILLYSVLFPATVFVFRLFNPWLPAPCGVAAASLPYGWWALFPLLAPLRKAFQHDTGGEKCTLKVQSTPQRR
jgi:hypothetical protein